MSENLNLQELYDKDYPLLDNDLVILSKFHDHFFTTDKFKKGKKPTKRVIKCWLWDTDYEEKTDRTISMLMHYVKTHWKLGCVGKRLHVTRYRDFVTNVY
jgi:hypothetical protein